MKPILCINLWQSWHGHELPHTHHQHEMPEVSAYNFLPAPAADKRTPPPPPPPPGSQSPKQAQCLRDRQDPCRMESAVPVVQQAPLSLEKSMEVLARLRAPSATSSARDAALWLQLTASGANPHADDPLDQAPTGLPSPDSHHAHGFSQSLKPEGGFAEGMQPPKTPKRSESPSKVARLPCPDPDVFH